MSLKIAYCSDLHLDIDKNAGFTGPLPDADVLILAGDIAQVDFLRDGLFDRAEAKNLKEFLFAVSKKYATVLWIGGNHEYYESSFKMSKPTVDNWLASNGITNITFDETIHTQVGNVEFIGASLWTDVNNNNPLAIYAGVAMNDYKFIDAGTFTIAKGIEKHYEHKQFIHEKLNAPRVSGNHRVVFTHHAPHYKSEENITRLTPFYCCTDMEDIISMGYPSYWIHGHTHHPTKYKIFGTDVVTNPRGYCGYESLANYFEIEVFEI